MPFNTFSLSFRFLVIKKPCDPMMSMTTSTSLPPLSPNKKIYRGESEGSTLTTGTSSIWEDEMGAASDQLFFVTSYR